MYGAEIGVAEGLFSEYMCKTIKGLKLLSVDTWRVGNDARSKQVGQNTADKRFAEAQKRLEFYDCKIMKTSSMNAALSIADESLDFCYLDACHEFDYIMEDLITWSRKVKPGGIVAGHDYYYFRNAGIIDAVLLYVRMHEIEEWFITDERTPSFFWVKQ